MYGVALYLGLMFWGCRSIGDRIDDLNPIGELLET
jgi:hypothetical protein